MSMTKIVRPDGWNLGDPAVQIIKIARGGLRGDDRRDFLKMASPMFLDFLDRHEVPGDVLPLRVIAMGATEKYGANRNGDGFRADTCRKYADTFVKYARWFRNHRNKNPKIGGGIVKAAAFNDDMSRLELIVFLNAKKSAADRTDGIIPEKTLEKLARGEDVATSMACSVDYDICSNCKNKAPTRASYCTEDTCVSATGEKRGGCRHHLGEVGEDGHMLHVDNPHPKWFDISDVSDTRGADRIAFAHIADDLVKAAADPHARLAGGAETAEKLAVTPPAALVLDEIEELPDAQGVRDGVKLAWAMAQAESLLRDPALAAAMADTPPLSATELAALGDYRTKAARAVEWMSQYGVLLPFPEFARWGRFDREEIKTASAQLPGLFRRLFDTYTLPRQIPASRFWKQAEAGWLPEHHLAGLLRFAVTPATITMKVARATVVGRTVPLSKDVFEKSASGGPLTRAAVDYGLYTLATIYRIAQQNQDVELTARCAVSQNAVCI